MKTIPLSQGQVALVDDADFDAINAFRWYAWKNPVMKSFYAVRTVKVPSRRTILMHRAIMGEPAGLKVDHRNHDTLDNRRGNLRAVTNSQNLMNRKGANVNSKTGLRGVTWNKFAKKWAAEITANRRKCHLGYFDDPITAAAAYDKANSEMFGEFGGKLNHRENCREANRP